MNNHPTIKSEINHYKIHNTIIRNIPKNMESNRFSNVITLEKTGDWYSEAFIRQSVEKFLKLNGYKIHKDASTERGDKTISASRFFKKELIEIKGFPTSYYANDTNKAPLKNDNIAYQAKKWFSEALFNSLVNFGNYYTDNIIVAMALPNVGRYKTIINRLQDYFTLNNLYFKIYLVNEDGSVEVSNLNEIYMSQMVKNGVQ